MSGEGTVNPQRARRLHDADVVYLYDGSFEGFLCCVFESFAQHEIPFAVWTPQRETSTLYPVKDIPTDHVRAQRVFATSASAPWPWRTGCIPRRSWSGSRPSPYRTSPPPPDKRCCLRWPLPAAGSPAWRGCCPALSGSRGRRRTGIPAPARSRWRPRCPTYPPWVEADSVRRGPSSPPPARNNSRQRLPARSPSPHSFCAPYHQIRTQPCCRWWGYTVRRSCWPPGQSGTWACSWHS